MKNKQIKKKKSNNWGKLFGIVAFGILGYVAYKKTTHSEEYIAEFSNNNGEISPAFVDIAQRLWLLMKEPLKVKGTEILSITNTLSHEQMRQVAQAFGWKPYTSLYNGEPKMWIDKKKDIRPLGTWFLEELKNDEALNILKKDFPFLFELPFIYDQKIHKL